MRKKETKNVERKEQKHRKKRGREEIKNKEEK
jgi:hypothetical protein